MTSSAAEQLLTGWGATAPTSARVRRVATLDEARDALETLDGRGAIARGLGRSYGAPAQNAGGTVLCLAGTGGDPRVDVVAQTVTAHAGLSLDALMRYVVPLGFFVPVTPGTRQVTVGGAIAADIHGKNHHVEGSFGNHIVALRLLAADGTVHDLSPTSDAPAFWATVGGMGLTGIVLEATIRLLPITSTRMIVDTERTTDLDDVCARMTEGDHRYRYTVAWVDLSATGRRLGRSILTRGDHAPIEAVGSSGDPLTFGPHTRLAVPPGVPSGVLNRASIRGFNTVWYYRAPRHRTGQLMSIGSFFHPLDGVRNWNRLYGPAGFVQYQVVVPFGAETTLRRIVERFVAFGDPSFLVVLKRFGAGNPGPLSFPMPGWTLTVDVGARRDGLRPMLAEMDTWVSEAGGRHYLAKDAHITAAALRAGYPRLEEWRAVRDKLDPTGVWTSDLARRLELVSR